MVFIQLFFQTTLGHVQINFVPLSLDFQCKVFHRFFNLLFSLAKLRMVKEIDNFVAAEWVTGLIDVESIGQVGGSSHFYPTGKNIVGDDV